MPGSKNTQLLGLNNQGIAAASRRLSALAAGDDAQVIRLCGEVRDWEQRELLAIAQHAAGHSAEAERQFGLLRNELAASGAVQYAEILAQWGQRRRCTGQAPRWLLAILGS